ncbi:2Fe-2S iron-sulfur cluster binding domain-containing protein [Candidimonas sp. SYP-B2681]|uniref:2Fe-2S iron-sulfur cluster-binding protein n=1 Tax=Candidimonas sp. SYP-B2681 TaxID=2497686 RepID=UPI000F86917F|nr:2Fe-2S iron-sulfur cluster-binding protein [Candidimonas sp. SYP-B2681]RTZ45486.1 2Fe-2S iron-sulfur cluster binding domain-containing protein [Candidimonas sp. SYP-B2681]
MSYLIYCKPMDVVFEADESETLLAAALRNGHVLPHCCGNGLCGTCKVRVVDGTVEQNRPANGALSDLDAEGGFALLCQSTPKTNVTVQCNVIPETAQIPVRRIMGRVHRLERAADDVMRIWVKLAEKDSLLFAAGQHVNFVLGAGVRRCISLANPPSEGNLLELHLKNYGGALSRHIFEKLKEKDLVRLEGPLGIFAIRRSSSKPIIFMAGGTGFSPIKSMIESLRLEGSTRPAALYWGGRRPKDLYLNDMAQAWADESDMTYVPVLSDAIAEDNWSGRTGFPHHAVAEDFPDLRQHQVYICGAPAMIEATRKELTTRCGLDPEDFFTDEFKKS